MALLTPPTKVTGPLPLPPVDGLRGAALDPNSAHVVLNPPNMLAPVDPQNPRPASADEAWLRGFVHTLWPCNAGEIRDICDHTTALTSSTTVGAREVQPWVVSVGRRCSTWGWNDPERDLARDANVLLEAFQWELIAREFWRGDGARTYTWPNPYLAKSAEADFVNLSPGAGDIFSPIDGLAALEDALAANSTGPRIIHAPRGLLVYWDAGGALRYDKGLVYTITGTLILADAGYDGSGPDSTANVAPTTDGWWAYGTGPIQVRLEKAAQISPPPQFADQAIDKLQNVVTYYAQRRAAVTYNCGHVAIQIVPGGTAGSTAPSGIVDGGTP